MRNCENAKREEKDKIDENERFINCENAKRAEEISYITLFCTKCYCVTDMFMAVTTLLQP
jgi:hypothetical protein